MVCTDRRSPRWRGWKLVWLFALALLAGLVTIAGASGAHMDEEHGELTVHDEEDGEPAGEISCEFWVQGHDVSHTNGTIEMLHDTGPSSRHNHTVANWSIAADASSFEVGPIEHHGHDGASNETRIRAQFTADHATTAHRIDHTECEDEARPLPGDRSEECDGPTDVVAWVDGLSITVSWEHHQDPDQTKHYEVQRSVAGERNFTRIAQIETQDTMFRDSGVDMGTTYTYVVTAVDAETDRAGEPCDHAQTTARDARPPPCPADVQAQALEEGDIQLAWKTNNEADAYKIYRATGNDSLGKINSVQDPGYTDGDTDADQTYRYRVVGASEDGESQGCPVVEATAIPSFPTGTALGLAAVGSVIVLAAVHRRR